MKRSLALASCLLAGLLVTPSVVAIGDEPMPPGYLDFEFTSANNEVRLFWDAPTDTGSNDLDEYLVYHLTEDGNFPPQSVSASQNETTLAIDPDKTYIVYVTAVNLDGEESLPSNPVVLRGDYPHCAVFGYNLDPPDVDPQPGCLLPPPV